MPKKDKVCRMCGFQCCYEYPGVAHPDDFERPGDLADALASGRYTVDEYELRGKKILFARAAVKGMEGSLRHVAYKGPCTFLEKDGCVLDDIDKPLSCRKIEPDYTKIGECKGRYKLRDAARWWAPYQDGVRAAMAAVRSRKSATVVRGPWGQTA
jgi:Fe-S-cluster containining protein